MFGDRWRGRCHGRGPEPRIHNRGAHGRAHQQTSCKQRRDGGRRAQPPIAVCQDGPALYARQSEPSATAGRIITEFIYRRRRRRRGGRSEGGREGGREGKGCQRPECSADAAARSVEARPVSEARFKPLAAVRFISRLEGRGRRRVGGSVCGAADRLSSVLHRAAGRADCMSC